MENRGTYRLLPFGLGFHEPQIRQNGNPFSVLSDFKRPRFPDEKMTGSTTYE